VDRRQIIAVVDGEPIRIDVPADLVREDSGHQHPPRNEPDATDDGEQATERRRDDDSHQDAQRRRIGGSWPVRIDADEFQKRLGLFTAGESNRARRVVVVDDSRRG